LSDIYSPEQYVNISVGSRNYSGIN